ncbi:hypothetical protein ACIQGO_34940 [Streptomyces shenzhenensis]|uniref:hypothetical protein n=1 Tax=Streptomyces shenzhenensis TaxID=943815 RepID=UPI00381E0A72
MSAAPPLAYIYDRCATDNRVVLDLRLHALGEYVKERGWGWGGSWVDEGDRALISDDRPAFDTLVRSMEASLGRERVCLVYDWGRLCHDRIHRQVFARRILLAGGWLSTISGDIVRHGAIEGSLTTTPQDVRVAELGSLGVAARAERGLR